MPEEGRLAVPGQLHQRGDDAQTQGVNSAFGARHFEIETTAMDAQSGTVRPMGKSGESVCAVDERVECVGAFVLLGVVGFDPGLDAERDGGLINLCGPAHDPVATVKNIGDFADISRIERLDRQQIDVIDGNAEDFLGDFVDRRLFWRGGDQLRDGLARVPGALRQLAVNLAKAGQGDRGAGEGDVCGSEDRSRKAKLDDGAGLANRWSLTDNLGFAGNGVGSEFKAGAAGGNPDLAPKGGNRAHHDAQSVAQHTAGWQALELG